MRWQIFPFAIFLSEGAVSSALSTTTNSTAPCGLITAKAMSYFSDRSHSGLFYFDTALGNECLESSSIDNKLAASFVQEYKKYVQFQTTLSYLKAPPPDYPYAPVDILGGLDLIESKAALGGFSSQYAFDQALAALLTSAHEGHLYTSLCTAGSILYFRSVNFISLSLDGVQLPLVYTLDDADAYTDNFTISNVVAINGQNVTSFIENEALFLTSDPDASYNAMFWNVAQAPVVPSIINATGALTFPRVNRYPGPYTDVTFANGTQKSYPNQAAVTDSWPSNIVDGDSFTHEYCIAPAQSADSSSATASSKAPTSSATVVPSTTSASPSTTSASVPNPPTMIGHPETPIFKDSNNAVAGYFLNGTDYNDTAVLYVASFANEAYSDPATYPFTFVNTTRNFLAAAKAAKKTKLVIDLSRNGGGNTLLPNDLFQRLFPHIVPYGAGRYRIPTAAEIYGQVLGGFPATTVNPLPNDTATVAELKIQIEGAPWNYRTSLTTGLQNLTGWDEFFPPNVVNGDNFTINVRAPTNNTYFDTSTDLIIVYEADGEPESPQPFPVENIVILTDGICASACSIFVEFMTRQAGVKTILVGGRPRNAPAQAIGGTKGSEAFAFTNFQGYSQGLLELGLIPDSLLDAANQTLPGLVNLPLGSPSSLASYSLNMRDNIPVGDDSQTPLQFVFEPADCRIFYTHMTASHPYMLWEYAADVAWKGKKCAWGGIKTNVTGSGVSTASATPTKSATPTGSGTSTGSGPLQVPKNDASGRKTGLLMLGAAVGFSLMVRVW